MHSRTVSVEIAVPAETVYRCVRDPQLLPQRAAGICKSVTVQNDVWHIDTGTGLGIVQLSFCADNAFGVFDHRVTLSDGRSTLNPMRAVADGENCVLLFTVFQTESMSDVDFVRDVRAVTRDLKTIKVLLEPHS